MDRIAGAAGPPRRVILDWDLVIGGSCGPAPRD
jgi:hypothetical protein